MSAYFTHTLKMNREEVITHGSGDSLAFVDLESYQPYVGPEVDRLDLMVHLQNQMNALTAFAWDVPDKPLQLRLLLTGDHQAMERITRSNRPPSASGTLRTYGRICLVGHDRLIDCAQHADHSLLKGGRLPKGCRPHVLDVPPGILYILVYRHLPSTQGDRLADMLGTETQADYTVFLHHYPHPAHRIAPVRLPALIPWAA